MDKTSPIIAPVLVIGFNRPDVLRQCIDKLRESKPHNIYLACDGARENREGEKQLVAQVRHIMEDEIDWSCDKHYRYNEENKGCEVTESEAISWVLEENETVIVIEDDIIAPYSFLNFAQDMLERYKDNENVYMISSCNTTPIEMPNDEDYLFSMYGHIWGWATWRRAWKHFNLYAHDFDETLRNIPARKDLTDLDKKRLKSMCKTLNTKQLHGGVTWDIMWSYVKWRDGGLSIIPKVHLSSNVGCYGLHTKGKTSGHFRPYDEEFQANRHPAEVKRNIFYDDYHYNLHIKQPPFLIRIWRRGLSFIRRVLIERHI